MATILIVDDDPRVNEFVEKHLRAAGHQCIAAGSGEQALQRVAKDKPDLLILDVMLPDLSGFELCRRIRSNPALYVVPILFLSAMDAAEEVRHGLAQGADDYLTKPFRVDTLLAHVDRLLATSNQNGHYDDLTELPGPKHIKMLIQKAITQRKDFALAYVELLRLGEFARLAGNDARIRAVRHLARGLNLSGEKLGSALFTVGHMGAGHFVCLLDPGAAESFSKRVRELWLEHLETLYTSVGQERVYTQAQPKANGPTGMLLDVLFCITMHAGNSNRSVNDLFETLSHLRQNALSWRSGGVHIDRRT